MWYIWLWNMDPACWLWKIDPCFQNLRWGSISYLEHKTNDWVWSKINFLVGPQEPLLTTVKRQKLAWFPHVTTASPKPSFKAPWRVGDAVVSRWNLGWTASKCGHPCTCQNWSQGPPAVKTGRGSLLNRPSSLPPPLPFRRPNRSKDWTEHMAGYSTKYFHDYSKNKESTTTCTILLSTTFVSSSAGGRLTDKGCIEVGPAATSDLQTSFCFTAFFFPQDTCRQHWTQRESSTHKYKKNLCYSPQRGTFSNSIPWYEEQTNPLVSNSAIS